MKRKILAFSVLSAAMLASSPAVYAADKAVSLTDEARALAKQFGGQLKPELKKAMKSGGPVKAVEVCHQKAPAIATELSKSKGWDVSRVSLKERSVMAKPDAWEKKILNRFNLQKVAGVEVGKMEFAEVVQEQGKSTFRYMKAIGTADICLKCHGTNVAAPVKQALAKYYPQDKATGFVKGDIRGAFSFSKELK